MTHFFEKRDRWGNGMALWVIAVLAFFVPIAWWSIKQIHLENDVENWLASDDPGAKVLRWTRGMFPVEDRTYITWDGSSLTDPRVQKFAERLEGTVDAEGIRRNGLPQIEDVAVPHDVLQRMTRQGVATADAVARLSGVLIGAGPLKIRLTDAGGARREETISQLAAAIRKRLGVEPVISEPAEDLVLVSELDALQNAGASPGSPEPILLSPAGQRLEGAAAEHDFQVGWGGMGIGSDEAQQIAKLAAELKSGEEPLVEDAFFALGSPVALSVRLSEAGIAEKNETFVAIREAAAEVGIPPSTLSMGGSAVAARELNQAVLQSAWDTTAPLTAPHRRSLMLLSCLTGGVLALVLLRSLRLAVLVLAVAIYTMFVSVALVPVTGGSLNMVLIVMPTLLMVLTISGAIHVANYWKHAASRDVSTAVVTASRMAWQPCFLASVTTALGLISLATSELVPVRDFGIYSAVGTLISFVMVLYALPALLQLWPSKAPRVSDLDHPGWGMLGRALGRHNVLVTTLSLAAFAGCLWGFQWFRTETKVIRYFPQNSRIVRDYVFIEQNLAGIAPIELVVRFGEQAQNASNFLERIELVRAISSKIQAHPEISGAISLADFLPVSERPPENATFLMTARYNKRANTAEARVREDAETGAAAFYTKAALPNDLYERGDQQLNRAGDELWRITAQVAVMSELDYAVLTADLDGMAASVLKDEAGAGHFVTGTIPLFLRTQQAVLDSLIRSFGLAFAMIAVVMMILLRDPLAGLITMVPNLMPVGMVFGLIAWAGEPVDIGTMITASVALGIAVDGTLHLLTWFKDGIRQGMTRQEAVIQALSHCGPAMWQTSAVVGIGMMMLYPAELLLISRFGWLMAALVGMALLGDIIFLPALLAGPLGMLIQRKAFAADPTLREPPRSPPPDPHLNLSGRRSERKVEANESAEF